MTGVDLKAWRLAAKLSKVDVADALALSSRTIWRLERLTLDVPRPYHLALQQAAGDLRWPPLPSPKD